MATQRDLFLAILALDAYNRGYSPGMQLPSSSQIGDATIVADTNDDTSRAASFYAVAYNWEGQTIISYRGTRFPGGPDFGDVVNGWTLSAGYAAASQAQMALNFYNQVKAEVGAQSIVLTGHSLGGGLAGFVADLTGASADIFNNIPFGTGVAVSTLSPSLSPGTTAPTSSSNVNQFITFGEVATGLRATTSLLSLAYLLNAGVPASIAASLVAYGTLLDNTTSTQTLNSNVGLIGADPTNLHSQSLMVLLLYANVNQKTDWASVGKAFYNALFSDAIATKLNFLQTSDGWYTPSAKMMAAIAYSALYNPG